MGEAEDRSRRERDMVLSPNEFMYVQDETKGEINIFVGPTKQSLSGTDQPVLFDEGIKRFRNATFAEAKQGAKTAPEGWYVVLKNPAKDGAHPSQSGKVSSAVLEVGRKVNIPGPVSFCLWPGQMAKILKGHILRSNQYLLVRVYDEEAARANWSKAVITSADEDAAKKLVDPTKLTMGQTLVIRGTDVSFYIPPTGVEVVPDQDGELVREAVTLETLEYCLLMDENGNKRYEKGPAVVFPEPTEVFVERKVDEETATRKFRAIELDENSGIHIKVIADYEDGGKQYKVGNELFITGKDQMIYFPREEHAIVKYDRGDIYHGIAIPAGEARYVLDRNSGEITVVKGPKIFLPDPRRQVIAQRILDFKTCSLLYPNNQAAFAHNASLAGIDLATYMDESASAAPVAVAGIAAAMGGVRGGGIPGVYAMSSNASEESMDLYRARLGDTPEARGMGRRAAREFAGDALQRKTKFTEPRSITLPTKYNGAVSVDIWTGYAMMLVRKSGERKVVQGPRTVLLEYDEVPQVLTLSTGKPKSTDNLFKTAFLLTSANKVADIVEVETKDFCKLLVKLSYRVNFEGDPEKWFNVENYVKFLCDNMRSKIRNAGKKFDIEDFYGDYTEILRDIILGEAEEGGHRPGTSFEENGMRIYDVEVLQVEIQDKDVSALLTKAQREALQGTLKLAGEKRTLGFLKESEAIKRETETETAETRKASLALQAEDAKRKLALDLEVIKANAESAAKRIDAKLKEEQDQAKVDEVHLARNEAMKAQEISFKTREQEIVLNALRAEVQAVVDRAKGITPGLVEALNSFGERAMIEKVAQALSPMALLGGTSVVDAIQKALKGTGLEKALALLPKENGAQAPTTARS